MILALLNIYTFLLIMNIDRKIDSFQDLKSLVKEIEELSFSKKSDIDSDVDIADWIEFIGKIQNKHSLACSTLEIIRNWDIFNKEWFNA